MDEGLFFHGLLIKFLYSDPTSDTGNPSMALSVNSFTRENSSTAGATAVAPLLLLHGCSEVLSDTPGTADAGVTQRASDAVHGAASVTAEAQTVC